MEIKITPVEQINQTWLTEHKVNLENEIQRIDNITSNFTQNLNTIERLILKSYTDLSLSKGLYGGCEELK